AADAIRRELTARRCQGETLLRERLERAKREGETPPVLDPADFARYIMTVLEGMSVRAADGASRQGLHRVAAMAPRPWPACGSCNSGHRLHSDGVNRPSVSPAARPGFIDPVPSSRSRGAPRSTRLLLNRADKTEGRRPCCTTRQR